MPPRVAFNHKGIDEETHMKVIKQDLLMNNLPEKEEEYKFELSETDPNKAISLIFDIMNSDDSRLFTKSENTDLAQNLGHLLDSNIFPKYDTKLILLFIEVMAENEKNIN